MAGKSGARGASKCAAGRCPMGTPPAVMFCRRGRSRAGSDYFFLSLPAVSCLAMIWSLMLSYASWLKIFFSTN